MTKILQLKITLEGISPKIWRRFLVKGNISFRRLHEIIQIAMGWDDYHLFEFKVGDAAITSDEEGHNAAEGSFKKLLQSPEFIKMLENTKLHKGSASLDVNKLNKILKKADKNKVKNKYKLSSKLNELLLSENQEFSYLYDFGDNWEHSLIVEKIFNDKDVAATPVCLEGERAGPPEDCGSYPGYYELIKIRKNKRHPEYRERIVEWLGEEWDFEHFDLDEINKKLLKLISINGRAGYWAPK